MGGAGEGTRGAVSLVPRKSLLAGEGLLYGMRKCNGNNYY